MKKELRTEANDNDLAKKYFRDPSELIRQKEAAMRDVSDADANALIQKLRKQSEDNREKNELYVQRKTFEADQVIIRTIACTYCSPPIINTVGNLWSV